jgi:hypothetical protein
MTHSDSSNRGGNPRQDSYNHGGRPENNAPRPENRTENRGGSAPRPSAYRAENGGGHQQAPRGGEEKGHEQKH